MLLRIAILGCALTFTSCIDLATATAVSEVPNEPDTSVCTEATEYLPAELSICTEAFMYEHTACSVPTVTAVVLQGEDEVDDEMLDCDEQDCD